MSLVQPGPRNLITDVHGLSVGNAEDHTALTGVTVVRADQPAVAAVDVRGGAPGTRDTDALAPDCFVDQIHAVTLAGGSVFGLEAASGVQNWLSGQGIGLDFANQKHRIPLVPSAILFDLSNGGDKDWGASPPYRKLGEKAVSSVARDFQLGNAGAGLGATAGSLKGGLGSASAKWQGYTVGALVAANPVGSVYDPRSGDLWARPLEMGDEMGGKARPAVAGPLNLDEGTKLANRPSVGENTTIAVVACDALLDKAQCRRLAIMASDGMARAIRPVHAMYDGDTVFALSIGQAGGKAVGAMELTWLGTLAADCLTRAIGRAVWEAKCTPKHQSYRNFLANRRES